MPGLADDGKGKRLEGTPCIFLKKSFCTVSVQKVFQNEKMDDFRTYTVQKKFVVDFGRFALKAQFCFLGQA